jgi:PAS domain S-box-containing protein
MLGYTQEEIKGITYQQTTPVQWHEMERNIVIYKILKTGYSDIYEKEYIKKDGTVFSVSMRVWAIKDEAGNITGMWGIVRDITEHTKQLEAANKELESFSYSVAHDLRAPLRAIDGYARMILKKHGDKFDEDALNKFSTIRSNTHMMGQLIDDLLSFSRLGKKHISLTIPDMDAVVRDVWKEMQVINPNRNMVLTVNCVPPGYGDRALIKQVYLNLLFNAVKFTKYRDAAHIEAGGYTDGNEGVYYVRDDGVGFDMKYYDKLFGVFQRLHNPDDFDGTGVGLAIVQRIIHRHGGRVWAEGKVNEGATIYFTLPQGGDTLIS